MAVNLMDCQTYALNHVCFRTTTHKNVSAVLYVLQCI